MKTTIFQTIVSIAVMTMMISAAAKAGEFELDRGIGYKKGRDIESWMDAKESSENSSLYRQFNQDNGSLGAAAVGNLISIQTKSNSHVVVNATQINSGNQTVEVNLRGAKQYKNVEAPQNRLPDEYLSYQR